MIELTDYQMRVVGCLLEKEVTTPDQYPLTLNSLTMAVNQKSSRDPVYSLSEGEILDVLEQLKAKHLVSFIEGFGYRVIKYQHRFCNTEFSSLQLCPQQKALICLLLLRGPQMPGELRTRSARLCEFTDTNELIQVLNQLINKGLVAQLPREHGKRENRYISLFNESKGSVTNIINEKENCSASSENKSSDQLRRIEALEQEIAELKILFEQLKNKINLS